MARTAPQCGMGFDMEPRLDRGGYEAVASLPQGNVVVSRGVPHCGAVLPTEQQGYESAATRQQGYVGTCDGGPEPRRDEQSSSGATQ